MEVLRDSLQGKLESKDLKMLNIIDSESLRLTKTLERILGYARPVRPNPKMLQLDDVIERTLDLVRLQRKTQGENGVAVEKKYDLKTTHVYADEEQLISALLNLTLNAYQAMSQGGFFRIVAEEDVRGTRIDLEDTGQGISSEKMKDLFQPFKSSKKGGTGLGLAEVHKILTLHEGKIQVESQVGKGTVFHLYFPKP
jgi:signal transduction histidine kinase